MITAINIYNNLVSYGPDIPNDASLQMNLIRNALHSLLLEFRAFWTIAFSILRETWSSSIILLHDICQYFVMKLMSICSICYSCLSTNTARQLRVHAMWEKAATNSRRRAHKRKTPKLPPLVDSAYALYELNTAGKSEQKEHQRHAAADHYKYQSCEKNRSIPQFLTMRDLHIVAIQLFVMATSPCLCEPGTIPGQRKIVAGMTLAKNALVKQT